VAMKLKSNITLIAFIITVFLFATLLMLGTMMNNKREDVINAEFQRMYKDFNSMQMLTLIQGYNDSIVCIAFENKIKDMDNYIWELGEKIDKYRVATEEFQKDKYYLSQKETFNENEVFYYLLMSKMMDKCNITKEPVLFFYKNSADCRKCDDQSFVLTDIREMDDDNEIAVFSFDSDLNLSSVDMFKRYYGVDEYPCLVFTDGTKMCGMQDKDVIVNKICELNPAVQVCRPTWTYSLG
jgi:hypothetical protein